MTQIGFLYCTNIAKYESQYMVTVLLHFIGKHMAKNMKACLS